MTAGSDRDIRPGDQAPLLALTPGDPAGIGPEVLLAALADGSLRAEARLLVVGDAGFLAARARRLGLAWELPLVGSAEELARSGLRAACLAGASRGPDESVLGRVDADCGRASVEWVKEAARLALAGSADGIVTGPVNKLAMKRAGFAYEGHTELLAELSRAKPVMMLVGGGLRVALVTRHCALRDVPGLLSRSEIVRTAREVDSSLRRDFGVASPSIGVLALNPHASDGGRFGDEEKAIIEPALRELAASGLRAQGPLVPDVAFWRALRGEFDALVAMYHDQGLIPLKTIAFDRGVNVTLGLPILRTSPDHGTAFELAGAGKASSESFKEAVRLAARIARRRKAAS